MRKSLYLMRHGRTMFNEQGRTQGSTDSPLTALGIQQAKTTHAFLQERGIHFDKVITSTQERACDTAELVQDGPYKRVKGIKEWHFGIFEAQPDYIKDAVHRPEHYMSYEDTLVPFGAESRLEVGKRVEKALIEELESMEGQKMLAVSHAGAMWAFALTADLDEIPQPRYSNCMLIHYEYENGKFYFIEKLDPLAAQ